MKIKQKLKNVLIVLAMVVGGAMVAMPTQNVNAVDAPNCDTATENCCGGVQTSIIKCTETGDSAKGVKDTGIWGILLLVINIMTAGVGILAVAGIVYGSVLYASAGGSAEQVKKAVTVFTNVVIGIVAYVAMYAFLNFIIPGGLFAS